MTKCHCNFKHVDNINSESRLNLQKSFKNNQVYLVLNNFSIKEHSVEFYKLSWFKPITVLHVKAYRIIWSSVILPIKINEK